MTKKGIKRGPNKNPTILGSTPEEKKARKLAYDAKYREEQKAKLTSPEYKAKMSEWHKEARKNNPEKYKAKTRKAYMRIKRKKNKEAALKALEGELC